MKFSNSLQIATLAIAVTILSPMAGTGAEDNDAIHLRDGFHNFRNRASSKKMGHVAFLGGSITQNTKGHTAMLPAWLQEQFPDTAFTFTNAGLSSTCSVTGAFRVAEDVLAKGPVDLFVVEFAVNDDQDAGHDRMTAIRGMEGIIRQVRRHNPAADILMVHFVNPALLEKALAGEKSISIDAHEAVAEHWNITTVNIAVALANATKEGTFDWKTYGGVHPKAIGYQFATDLMIDALKRGMAEGDVAAHATPDPLLDEASYGKVKSLDLQHASWLGGWRYGPAGKDLMPLGAIRADYLNHPLLRGDEPGSMLYVEFMGRALTAFVLAGPDAGAIEISIDSGDWTSVPLFHHYSSGLNYPRTVILADNLKPGFHQAALRIAEESPNGSKGHAVSILKIGINE